MNGYDFEYVELLLNLCTSMSFSSRQYYHRNVQSFETFIHEEF